MKRTIGKMIVIGILLVVVTLLLQVGVASAEIKFGILRG